MEIPHLSYFFQMEDLFKFNLAIKLNFKQGRMILNGYCKVDRLFSSILYHYITLTFEEAW